MTKGRIYIAKFLIFSLAMSVGANLYLYKQSLIDKVAIDSLIIRLNDAEETIDRIKKHKQYKHYKRALERDNII